MRKQRKESKILKVNGIIAIIERLKNDKNGNPKFQVQFINTNDFWNSLEYHNTVNNNQYYTVTSYNIDLDVTNYIKNNIINNWE